MPAESWKTSETDIAMTRTGIMNQAVAHGLDLDDPKIMSFIEHEIKVQAASSAECRWLRSIIDEMSARINKVTPES